MQYAQIKSGKVNLIKIADATALEALRLAGLTIIDISNLETQPKIGWVYDANTNTFSAPEEEQFIYLHLNLSGGDGEEIPGIANDGTESITVTAALRLGSEEDSDIIALDFSIRVNILDNNNTIVDIIKVNFVSGECSFNYTTTGNRGDYRISDVYDGQLNGYSVKVLGDLNFKVYKYVSSSSS